MTPSLLTAKSGFVALAVVSAGAVARAVLTRDQPLAAELTLKRQLVRGQGEEIVALQSALAAQHRRIADLQDELDVLTSKVRLSASSFAALFDRRLQQNLHGLLRASVSSSH